MFYSLSAATERLTRANAKTFLNTSVSITLRFWPDTSLTDTSVIAGKNWDMSDLLEIPNNIGCRFLIRREHADNS